MSIILNGTTGITTPGLINTGAETVVNLTTSGNTILGDASTDTLNVAANTLVTDGAGKVGIGTASPSEKLTVSGNASLSGNLTFTGTGNRITGDFSNGTVANRVAFQSSTTNGNTGVFLLPNGTAVSSAIRCFNNSDPTDASYIGFDTLGNTDTRITTSITGTGTYLPMTFYTGGSERMRIDSSGNVGIGTSSPTGKLDVNGKLVLSGGEDSQLQWTNNSQTWRINNSTGGQLYIYDVTGTKFPFKISAGASSDSFVINSSGNVGIGTSSPSSRLTVAGTTGVISLSSTTGTNFSLLSVTNTGTSFYCGIESSTGSSLFTGTSPYSGVIGTTAAYPMAFATNNAERMRIDSSGNLLVGQTSTSAGADGRLSVTTTGGSPAATFKNDAGASQFTGIFYNSATTGNNGFLLFGTETSYTTRGSITYNRGANLVAYNTTSDQRLKENIVDASSALSKIDSVKVRSFDWKETGNHVDFGVIAQELITVAPECVTEGQDNEDGTIKNAWSVDTSALVPALVKAIQELKAELDIVKAELNTLKGN